MNCKEEEEAKTIWYSMDVIVAGSRVSLVCVKPTREEREREREGERGDLTD